MNKKQPKNNINRTKYFMLSFAILGIIIFMIIGSTSNTLSSANDIIKEETILLNEEVKLDEVHNIIPVFEDIVETANADSGLTVSVAEAIIEPMPEIVNETETITEEASVTQEVVEQIIEEQPIFNGPSYEMIDYYANNFYQMANDYPDWYWMSKIIMAESEGESEEGQIAVGNVILNRVNSPSFDNTIKDVIHASGQFSVFANGRINLYPSKKCITSAYKVLYQNAKAEGMFDQVPYFRSDRASWWRGVYYWKTIGNHHFAYAK